MARYKQRGKTFPKTLVWILLASIIPVIVVVSSFFSLFRPLPYDQDEQLNFEPPHIGYNVYVKNKTDNERGNADRTVKNLQRHNFPNAEKVMFLDHLFRIKVETCRSLAEAEQIAERLRKRGFTPVKISEPNWFGRDHHGRDAFRRIIASAKSFFFPGLLAVAIALSFGSILGVFAGFYGGQIHFWLFRIITEVLGSFPRLIFILLIYAIFDFNIWYFMIVVGILHIPKIAQLVKAKVVALENSEFLEAAKALGLKDITIIFKHILWKNCLASLMIQITYGMADAILVETTMSYLIRLDTPEPTLGRMIYFASQRVSKSWESWWAVGFPALVLIIAIVSFHQLGDALNSIPAIKRSS